MKSGKEMLEKKHFVRCQLHPVYFIGNKTVCVLYFVNDMRTKMSILGKGSMRDKAKVILIINNGYFFSQVI